MKSNNLSLIARARDAFFRRLTPKLQDVFRLNGFTDSELRGGISRFSYLKFVKYSIFDFPFELGRTVRGVRFNLYSPDAFSSALSIHNPNRFDVEKFSEYISNIYSVELSMKIRDKLPILASTQLGSLPLWTMSYPWEDISPFSKLEDYPKKVLENRTTYLDADSHINLNQNFLDPSVFGRSHGLQFAKLLSSINLKGYIPRSPWPSVFILFSGQDWRWIMSGSGNHRAYLLNFLNRKSLPSQVVGIVDRKKLSSWPLVRSGVFDEQSAEQIFDSIFEGNTSHRGII